MPFLVTADYTKQIREHNLNQITDGDASIIPAVLLSVEAEITGYLKSRYNVPVILSATGTSRNQLLVMYAVDMVIYHLISRINPRQITQLRLDRYEAAVAWLKAVNRGEILPELPVLDSDNDGQADNSGTMTILTFEKRGNNY